MLGWEAEERCLVGPQSLRVVAQARAGTVRARSVSPGGRSTLRALPRCLGVALGQGNVHCPFLLCSCSLRSHHIQTKRGTCLPRCSEVRGVSRRMGRDRG